MNKYVNKNIDTSISAPRKATLARNKRKLNSVQFVDPYDHVNLMENTNDDTHLVDSNEKHINKYAEEE